jgi:hypothetical protein
MIQFLASCGAAIIVCLLIPTNLIVAQEAGREVDGIKLNVEEAQLYDSAREFSKSTLTDGKGWVGYESYLHPDFSRWSARNNVVNKQQIVDSIQQWWESGSRTKTSKEILISLQVVGNIGVIRKSVNEHYIDGKGSDNGSFSGYVTHVWLKENDRWRLLAATIQQDDAG